MKIYLKDTTEFNNNGLGFLTDILSAKVYDELNGNYYLEFEYLLNGKLSEYLVKENIVKCKVADGSEQLFIINNIEKNLKTIKITARHIFYRLIDNFLEDVYPKNLNGNTFLNWILEHTNYESGFTGYSNISNYASARYVRKNPIEAILGDDDNSMVNIFGGEIKRDNFTINFLTSIGSNKNEKLIFGKNIKEINIKEDATAILTRIMPIGFDGLILPERYIDSDLIDIYEFPKIGIANFDDIKYDPDDENAYHDIEEAYQAMRDRVSKLYENGIDKSKINIKINWLELSKTKEYEQYSTLERLYLGDSVICNIAGLDYSTKVIKTVYNVLTDTIDKFEIGTPSSNIGNSMNNINTKIEHINPQSIIEYVKNNATDLITQAMGGYVYKTQSELYIMDTNNPQTAQKVWRWNINGLGYSSTGINGPYELAMTMNGQIVADFITTGRLNTNVIEGYDQLVIKVSETETTVQDITTTTQTSEGNNNLYIEDAKEDNVISYSVDGATEQNAYQGNQLIDFNNYSSKSSNVNYSFTNDIISATMTSSSTYPAIKWNILDLIKENAGKTLYFNYETLEKSNRYGNIVQLNITTNGTNTWPKLVDVNGNKFSYTIPNDVSGITTAEFAIYTNNSSTASQGSVTITKPMLQFGTESKDYEPYVGGTESPNPDYPQKVETIPSIINLYDANYRTSNNIVHCKNGTATEENGEYTLTATGTDLYIWEVTSSGTSYSDTRGKLYEFTEDSYTVTITNPLFAKNFVTYYDENKVSLGYVSKPNTSFTFNKNDKNGAKYFSIRIGYGGAVSGTTYKFKVILEEGTVAHEYVPYGAYARVKITGKNLFNDNIPITSNGIVSTYNDDGSISYSGQASSNWADLTTRTSCMIPAGTTLTFSIDSSKNVGVILYFDKSNTDRMIIPIGSTSVTLTTTVAHTQAKINIDDMTIGTSYSGKIYPQLEESNTPTPYEQYKEKEVLIDMSKENLFDKNNHNVLNAYIQASSQKILESPNDRVIYIPCKPNTKYTISKLIDSNLSRNRLRIGETTDIPTLNMQVSNFAFNTTTIDRVSSYVYTTSSTTQYLVVYIWTANGDLTWEQMLSSIAIYESNNSTPYYELCSNKDKTIKDRLVIDSTGNCSITKYIGKRVFNGSESWGGGSFQSSYRYKININDATTPVSNDLKMLSNYFHANKNVLDTHITTGEIAHYQGTKDFYLSSSETSVANFKTWLSTHNTVVQYELATPETITLPNTKIPLFEGINHITLVDDLETDTSVVYYRKTPITDVYAYQRDLNNTNSNLNNTNNQVKQNSSDIVNTNNNLSNNYYTKGQVDEINTNTSQEIIEIRNQVLTNQSATEYSINVINQQLINGVTKFDTGTGFTFDIEGLKINKTDNPLKILIDNEGFVVSNDSETKLKADHTGVIADNMTVNKFYIQKPIRMERAKAVSDNTKDVLALFWIGVD